MMYEADRLQRRTLALCIAAALAPAVYAGPEGAQIVAGSGTVTRTDATTTLITQGSDRLAINWESFNVGANELVRFEQPSAQAAALNRIFDQNPSAILGAVEANGRVYLINPNGLVFGTTARINVGALIASSLELGVEDFAAGRYEFDTGGNGAGLVLNRGVITAATGGSVTLLGGAVANVGLIVADLGQVTLGAGKRARLDFDGDGLLYFEVNEALVSAPEGAAAAVSNTGTIRSEGGQVLLTARAAQGVFGEVVNHGGMIRATRIDDSGGVVRLLGAGGPVVATGDIDATGATAADPGGRVEVLGDRVGVLADARIDVSGSTGGSILIGGDRRGSGDDTSALTLVASDVALSADGRGNGDGGEIVVWADDGTWFRGSASARGGDLGGDGGFVEISGRESLVFSGSVDTSAPNGTRGMLLFDPSTITIVDGGPAADDTELPDISSGDGGNSQFTISESELESITANTDITLAATGNVVMENLTDNVLSLATDGGSLTITAGGSFAMHSTDTIRTEGGDVTIEGDGLTIGSINVRGQSGTETGGAIDLSSSAGATVTGNLTAAEAITLATAGSATITGNWASANAIAVSVDSDNNETATLRVAGTLAAPSVALGGSTTVNDILEGNPSGDDAFVGNAANAGTLNGMSFSRFATLSGLGGNDHFDVSASFSSVLGGAGNDTLASGAGANTWIVNGSNAGTLNATAFSGIENLAGGPGVDQFTFTASVSGAVTGGAGNDTFSVQGVSLASLDGGADSDTVTLTPGATVGALTGGAGTDTLASTTGTNTWVVDGLDSGTLNTTAFSAFENLSGGPGVDRFTFTASFTGAVTGGAGNDTFAVQGVSLASLDGGADSDTVTLTPGSTVAALTGGTGGADSDTLEMTAGTNGWTVTGTDAGVLNGDLFTEFENLSGGNESDTFTFVGTLSGTAAGRDGDDTFNVVGSGGTGSAHGGDGFDTLSYAGSGTARTLSMPALAANGIEYVVGSSSGADVLRGTGSDDTFVTTDINAGTVNGLLAYSSFESLEGLGGHDTFVLEHAVSGIVDGGADADTFAVGSGAVAATVVGGAGGDTLVSSGGTAVFTVNAPNAGTLNAVSFSAVENLTGSAGNDLFTFNAALTGAAIGLDGDDTFAINDGGSTGMIDGGAGTDTQTYAGLTGPIIVTLGDLTSIERLVGSSDSGDTLVGTAAANTFTTTGASTGTVDALAYDSFENLQGAGGADRFMLQHAPLGVVDGGDGGDTFTILTDVSGEVLGGSGADRFDIQANVSGNLIGGDGNDVYALADGVAAGGVLDGGTGHDQLDLSAYRSARNVVLTGAGASDGFDGNEASVAAFRNIDAVAADPASASSLRGVDADATWAVDGTNGSYTSGGRSLAFAGFSRLTGGAAADRFELGTGDVTGGLTFVGGAGNDRIEAAGALRVGGTLAIAGIETITNLPAGSLGASTLSIDGTTGGIGTAGAPLVVEIEKLEILRSDGGLFLVDRTGNLRVTSAQLGTGDARLVVDEGDLVVGFLDAGGAGGTANDPPAPGTGGNIELNAPEGSIIGGGAGVNIRGRTATLRADRNIGSADAPITIVIPSHETITLQAVNAAIDNPNLATVNDALVSGVFSDVTANATAAAIGAGAASSLLDASDIDWVGLDPNVALVDCVDPCVLLPDDQQAGSFALLRDATKLLVLRDGERLALIPLL